METHQGVAQINTSIGEIENKSKSNQISRENRRRTHITNSGSITKSGRQNICSESSVGIEVSWGIIANHHNKPSISPYLLSGSDLFGVLPNNLGKHKREKNEHELIPMEFIMASEA